MSIDACRDMRELLPEFCALLEDAINLARECGLEMRVIETYRSQARQDWLYAQGRTRPGNVVTHAKKSRHTDRCAADVVPVIGGNLAWNNRAAFDLWGQCAEECGLRWGGRFEWGYDGAHVELAE